MNPKVNTDADDARLVAYVKAAKERGVEHAALVAMLRQSGWSERSTLRALAAYYEEYLGAPVPARGGSSENSGEAFTHLIAFISLGFWATAVGGLFFTLIDRWFPAGNAYYSASPRTAVAGELATIIVAFPIFMLISRAIARGLRAKPESAESGVRKWLTYIALVVVAVILIGDAIWLLGAFLSNALTMPLVLRTVVLMSLAGGIFTYYLDGLRNKAQSTKRDRTYGALATAAVVFAVGLGFFWIGSPAHVSAVSSDDARLDRMRSIVDRIHARPRSEPLPRDLNDLPDYSGSKAEVRYSVVSASRYRLCANFETADHTPAAGRFAHEKGQQCFELSPGERV